VRPQLIFRSTILALVATTLSLIAACDPPHDCCRLPLTAATIRSRADNAAQTEADQEIEAAEADESFETATGSGATGRALAAVLAWRDLASQGYRPQVDAWLTVHISLFSQMDTLRTPGSTGRLADALPYDAPYHQAERAYALWVMKARPDRTSDTFANALFDMSETTLSSVDRDAIARDFLASHRYSRGSARGHARLDRLLVEPQNKQALRRAYREALGWSDAADKSEATRVGTCRSSVTLPSAAQRFDFIHLWTELQDDEPAWIEGARALVDLRVKGVGHYSSVLGSMWHRFPQRHGILLYVTASLTDDDRYSDFRTARTNWSDDFDGLPEPSDVDDMLAFDPRAALAFPRVVDLPSGAPHAASLITAVRALDADPKRLRYAGDPSVKSAVATAAEDMCVWRQPGEIAALKRDLASDGIAVSVDERACERKREWALQGHAPAIARPTVDTDC
jgi:hypothetical protein